MLAYNRVVQERRSNLKSLSDFSEETFEGEKESLKEKDSFTEEDIKQTFDKYKDMPQDELLKTFFSEVDKQKKDGTFDIENLKSLVNSMAPILTQEQLSNINSILERIR